ncbi:ABC transporter ATP-binding protein [Pandoraea fibrosis]|uniref:ABC transporter ATP-binding protein n=1 Tax=Pandoraea fibrosis TaxID=1891094 RepID=A0A5E4VK46_9BURK|nr:ABC transporter ATP-binding protein [Pandoraea fibrosis]VVE11435.1 ABC transporter ATP-binding protein [Pandoraea fibrosis]
MASPDQPEMSPRTRSTATATTSSEPYISVSGLCVDFETQGRINRVLNDIHLSVERGGFTSLVGPSGCGKSTLLKVLAGLQAPTTGRVSVGGMTPAEAVRQRRIGLVFQEAALMPWKSAFDNVCLLMELVGTLRDKDAIRTRALELLNIVGLGHAVDRKPSQLSGGMRQRVSIARALALDPEVLMMDEPFGALDAITREEMSDFLLDLWKRTGKTIVFVTHSIDEAVFLSREVTVMATGPARILECLTVPLAYPRNEDSYATLAFAQTASHLRKRLKEGHRAGRTS